MLKIELRIALQNLDDCDRSQLFLPRVKNIFTTSKYISYTHTHTHIYLSIHVSIHTYIRVLLLAPAIHIISPSHIHSHRFFSPCSLFFTISYSLPSSKMASYVWILQEFEISTRSQPRVAREK